MSLNFNLALVLITGTRSHKLKLVASILLISLSLFILVFHEIYPLRLTLNTGFLAQIPIRFWILIILISTLLAAITYILNNRFVSLVCTVVFFLVYSSYQFLFRGLFGGDYTIENFAILHENTHFSPETHFAYLEFSQSWLLHRIQHLVTIPQYDLLSTIEFGFLFLVVIFSISIWLFIYNNLQDGFYAFSASALFFVMIQNFLNFQYVPQFFALIPLAFLLAIHSKKGRNWTILKLVLFIALVLSHRMIFIFYLGAVILIPLTKGVLEAIARTENSARNSILFDFGRSITSPRTLLRECQTSILEAISQRSWRNWTAILFTTYLAIFLFHLVLWQLHMIRYLRGPHRGHTAAFLARFGIDVGGEEIRPVVEPTTQTLYHLSSVEITTFTTFGAMGVVAGVGLLIAVTSLIRPTTSYHPINLAVVLVAGVYFIGGIALNILGTRALQVLFLPLAVSISILDRRRMISLIIILLILTASPIIVANYMNNHAISGGHTTGDYYTEEAGQFIQDYEYETIVQARTTQYPVDVSGEREHIVIRQLLDLPGQEPRSMGTGTIIQFDYRLYHDVDRHFHTCNYNEQNVIYDNTNQLMLVGDTPFECTSYN